MANYCSNCGAPIGENQKFCSECGTPVQAPLYQQTPQNTYQQQPTYAQQMPQNTYQQQPTYDQQTPQNTYQQQPSCHQQPAYQQQTQTFQQPQVPLNSMNNKKQTVPKNKKKSKAWLVIILILLLAMLAFFGFRDGGWFRKKNVSYTPVAMDSLRAYAERLEEAGNTAAAEAVYGQIAQGGGAELIEESHENFPIIAASDEVDQLEEFANAAKGGVRE